MRKLTAFALTATLFCSFSASAQSRATESYDRQKTRLKATRFDSLALLRTLGKKADGQVIELRGQVKGSFARDGQRALLFQLTEGENVVVEAAESFEGATSTKPGAISRFLCRVRGTEGAQISLSLVAATDAPDPAQLFKPEDTELILTPPMDGTLPAPDQIVLGGDDRPAPVKIVVGGAAMKAVKSAPTTRKGNLLPSRGMSRPASSSRGISPYFGFDESQRAAYKSLARRNNPKLGDQMADYIATSILSAAQAHKLDPRFLAAIVKVESSFDPYCLSSSGAMGLGQLMPFNLKPLGVANAWDPAQNLRGSAKLLRQNLDIYARQPNGTLLAVAAYHAGVGAVNRAGKAVPPKASTQRYVWKVYYAYRALAPELFASQG